MSPDCTLRYDRLAAEAGGLGESHRWLVSRVPAGARVLDCGCAGGYLARTLVEQRGCVVDGIDLDPRAVERARAVCRTVHRGSLDDEDFLSSLRGEYDRILFGDTLEHLRSPEHALHAMKRLLRADGRVLVSMPNIAYWRIRWELLRGRFRYEDTGILDRTHLRFFTYRTARDLAGTAGFRVVRQDMTTRPPAVPLGSARLVRRCMRAFPNLFAYQSLLELESCPE